MAEKGPVNNHTQSGNWEILSSDEDKTEFNRIVDSEEFVNDTCNSDAKDGFDLLDQYGLFERDGLYFIALTDQHPPLWNILSPSKELIDALFSHAVCNYGR